MFGFGSSFQEPNDPLSTSPNCLYSSTLSISLSIFRAPSPHRFYADSSYFREGIFLEGMTETQSEINAFGVGL